MPQLAKNNLFAIGQSNQSETKISRLLPQESQAQPGPALTTPQVVTLTAMHGSQFEVARFHVLGFHYQFARAVSRATRISPSDADRPWQCMSQRVPDLTVLSIWHRPFEMPACPKPAPCLRPLFLAVPC